MKHILFGALIALGFSFSHASAETCGGVYKIKRGDTLSQIADGLYKDARKWTAVYNANTAVIGDSPNRVFCRYEAAIALHQWVANWTRGGASAFRGCGHSASGHEGC